MGKTKTALAVAGIIILGGGVYYAVATYFPHLMPFFNEEQQDDESRDIVLEKADIFTHFPYDTQVVFTLDLSESNQSIINYGQIKDRYPVLIELENKFMEEFNKNSEANTGKTDPFNEPIFESLSINAKDIWASTNGSFTFGMTMRDDSEVPDFVLYAELNDPQTWREILTSVEAKDVTKIDDTHYYMENPNPDEPLQKVYVEVEEDYLKVSSYELPMTLDKTLADNENFKKFWSELPNTSLFSLYFDTESLLALGEILEDPSFAQVKDIMAMEYYAMAGTLFADELVFVQISSVNEESELANLIKENSSFPLMNNLPQDTLFVVAYAGMNTSFTTIMKFFENNAEDLDMQTNAIKQGLADFETMYGINLEDLMEIMFSNDAVLALVEVDNPMIPVSAVLLSELDTENEDYPGNVDDIIASLENSIVKIVEDELVMPDKKEDFSFLDDKTSDFDFRKFAPDPKFQLGMYHSMDVIEGVWAVTTSEDGLQKVYYAANTMVDIFETNARYKVIKDRIKHSEYYNFMFVDVYRTYRLLKPLLGAGMSDEEFETFETDINPHLEKLHSIYAYSTLLEEGVVYEKIGFVFE